MITNQPCGCRTKPLDKHYKIKKHLLEGNIVWFDDPHCKEHEDGSGLEGFMIYKNGVVHSLVVPNSDRHMGEPIELSLSQAIWQLDEFFKFGCDFSYGKASLKLEGDHFRLYCGGEI
ncbi:MULTISPECIES: hypothetical protein [unclassified Psychrobacillus]|uniref:hypothetical protein n=1 Tax=unclassified Psychrobacillus TaxID=2636677 RepID=UPI0030FD1389